MRTELLNRYHEEWNALLRKHAMKNFGVEQPTNPLLLEVPPSYFAADYRVMIFGQETNNWEGVFPHVGGVGHLLKVYEGFYTEGQGYPHGGQFWNGVKKLKGALEGHPALSEKSVAVLWNNLIKIGKAKNKGMPNEAIREWQSRWFDVIAWEVKELKPNLVIFFSGPNYDWFIKRIFDDADFQDIGERPVRQLARVRSGRLPTNSIRTYHPNYLWRHGFYEYLAEIIAAIRF